MTTDVVIVGAGPNGLLMACELALAGVRAAVLERLPERATAPKANGLVGRVVQALDYRGLYQRFSGSSRPPVPVPGFQFGALPLNLSALAGNALYALPIPQRRMEELLEERARELGVQIRRGHELVTVHQTADLVTAGVRGPDGRYELSAKFLVGADGAHSIVRKCCGIDFPGITDRGFVSRSGQVAIHAPVAIPGTGELQVPGAGRFRPATFTRTENGLFAYGMFRPGLYRVAVDEWVSTLRRITNLMAGTDVRYGTPTAGPAHAMAGQWMPDIALHTAQGSTRIAELLRAARPILLTLTGRTDLAETARDWSGRVDVITATTAEPPAEAILIRPDGYVAWAAATGATAPADGLRAALQTWFGAPAA